MSCDVQNAQRVASIAISLLHSGQRLVVGSAGGSFLDAFMSALIGTTTKKYTEKATRRNEMSALMKSPYMNWLPWIVNVSPEKFGALNIAAIKGVMRSFTNDETIVPKDAPTTTPTARSTTLPRRINCLNPEKTPPTLDLISMTGIVRAGEERSIQPCAGSAPPIYCAHPKLGVYSLLSATVHTSLPSETVAQAGKHRRTIQNVYRRNY